LDLGCGTGRHVIFLAEKGFELYGLDIAEEGIKLAKSRLKEKGLKANLKIGSFYEKLPYEDNFFDAIISNHAFHHAGIEEIRKAISEVYRILKPGGYIFLDLRKRRVRKYDPKRPIIEKYGKQKVSYRLIAPRTYVPIEGDEKDLPHYLFSRELIKKEFKNFKPKVWVSESGRYYYLLGKKI
jgi:ubiquinone/menaquinone biosynthesis C-methylase UbiE